mmetsp:Transcript_57678/g.124720  ORF Transcript_57678/g.124720 Transcript_57678/m.124720 type:complete len:235 (-) Transcript_57678:263-967(-)
MAPRDPRDPRAKAAKVAKKVATGTQAAALQVRELAEPRGLRPGTSTMIGGQPRTRRTVPQVGPPPGEHPKLRTLGRRGATTKAGTGGPAGPVATTGGVAVWAMEPDRGQTLPAVASGAVWNRIRRRHPGDSLSLQGLLNVSIAPQDGPAQPRIEKGTAKTATTASTRFVSSATIACARGPWSASSECNGIPSGAVPRIGAAARQAQQRPLLQQLHRGRGQARRSPLAAGRNGSK